ncbi:magnesium transporter [Enterobacterales bacterium CwR94]|nr:magnesium transporter [Enterobacterales bacterium CwR94]
MNRDFLALPEEYSIEEARRYFLKTMPEGDIPSLLPVISSDKELCGVLSLKKLLQAEESHQPISSLLTHDFFQLSPGQTRSEVAEQLSQLNVEWVPIVLHKRLVGVLGEREIHRLLADDVTEDAQRQGASLPLETPYLQTSPWTLWRKRAAWLLMLFVAEAYTGNVLKAFEEQLEAAIALAFFIPLLIGTGGNSGTQITSTLVRAMALGEVSLRNVGAVIRKEVSTSLLIALTIGVAAWIRAWIMGVGVEVTLVVSITLVAITIWSAIVSSIIPMVLKKVGIDPAVVSAPFIATFIDGTGLIIYFKIAQLVMGI